MPDPHPLSDLIDLARGDTIQSALLHDLADGGAQLSDRQRERVQRLNRYAGESIEVLLQGLRAFSAMLCHASPAGGCGPTQQDYAESVSFLSTLSSLTLTVYHLEAETATVLERPHSFA
ncbi:MAG TPA: hypothetical protein VK971_07490 [Thiohalobacter sp.]|nr:hypothetical protein [Thiohalobacter sp.]